MRKRIVAGNWKMNKDLKEAEALLKGIAETTNQTASATEIIVFPPFPYLKMAVDLLKGKVKTGAQNLSEKPNGAFTGEVSAEMIASTGATHVLVGHSERRQYFGEDHQMLKNKTKMALDNGLNVIYCCGESLEERESGIYKKVIQKQVEEVLFGLTEAELNNVSVAYEPVWAIGTGKTATSMQAQEVHQFIRSIIAEDFGKSVADAISLLYGGSCKPENASELLKEPDIDGGLIGGASLNATDFMSIVNA